MTSMTGEAKGPVGAVLVVGGGIGGIQAALDLADSGYKVYLVESSPSIGGTMSQLDKTFPTNDCSMCILSPKLVQCGRHRNTEVMTLATVTGLAGEVGDFTVQVQQQPRYIDTERCTGCGVCARLCPVSAVDSYNQGLSQRAATYIRYPQAVPLAYAIDRDKCIGCGLCQNLCLANAVRYDDEPRTIELRVGAIILAPGFEEFDARLRGEYGYGRYPNVVTSIEFERILSASGPFKGRVQRPSDGDIPRRIAFIQCVGSRDPAHGRGYCSSVCCMYATKEAVIAKEHTAQIEATIFYIDVRSHGKDFERYVARAQHEHGVRFVRHMVSQVREDPRTNDLLIRYQADNGTMQEEVFNLVVLSVGLEPSPGAKELADRLGIETNAYGFCQTDLLAPLATSRPGIYVCGAFAEPKDIPETVTQASGAAALVSGVLAPARGTLVKEKVYPAERDVRGEPPRVGVFVCFCGINIGGVVNVPEVVAYARTLPNVVHAESNLYTCSQDTQERIKEAIVQHGLNRVVVASCSPRTHEPLFQETLQEAGLNRYLFEMANIRDQCSWVHMHQPQAATEKARDLVRMAVAKAGKLEPLRRLSLPVAHSALVIGGGLAGMSAALALADAGFGVYVVERQKRLGGMLQRIHYTLAGQQLQPYLRDLEQRLYNNPRVEVLVDTEIADIAGYVGNFATTVRGADGEERQLKHGVVIVATGAEEYRPTEYGYGQDQRVVTQSELEGMLASGSLPTGRLAGPATVVMIQCVGSRNSEHPYCSRVCCSEAVKNALRIKQANPETSVFILYRDMRTYGFREDYYRQARAAGVIFLRYDEGSEPHLSRESQNGRDTLLVTVRDPSLDEAVTIAADLLVLSAGIVPRANNAALAQMLKIPLNADGFFLEAHAKLRPVDFATEGVYVCGLAHSPRSIEETIAQAQAAAARAGTILAKETIEAEGIVPTVRVSRCTACGQCELTCAYKAIQVVVVDQRRGIKAAQVNEALCKGCGACAAGCRSSAVDLRGFSNDQVAAAVRAAIRPERRQGTAVGLPSVAAVEE